MPNICSIARRQHSCSHTNSLQSVRVCFVRDKLSRALRWFGSSVNGGQRDSHANALNLFNFVHSHHLQLLWLCHKYQLHFTVRWHCARCLVPNAQRSQICRKYPYAFTPTETDIHMRASAFREAKTINMMRHAACAHHG